MAGRPPTGHKYVYAPWEVDDHLDHEAVFTQFEPHRPHSPEVDLWRAIFLRGIKDYFGMEITGEANKPRVIQEAREWAFDDSEAPGSFLFCCQVLRYDGSAVRRALRERGVDMVSKDAKRN